MLLCGLPLLLPDDIGVSYDHPAPEIAPKLPWTHRLPSRIYDWEKDGGLNGSTLRLESTYPPKKVSVANLKLYHVQRHHEPRALIAT
jgi:hypothetical protein